MVQRSDHGKNIANRLVKLRGCISQADAANGIGCSLKALQAYEKAERIPNDAMKIRIASFYCTTVPALFFFP